MTLVVYKSGARTRPARLGSRRCLRSGAGFGAVPLAGSPEALGGSLEVVSLLAPLPDLGGLEHPALRFGLLGFRLLQSRHVVFSLMSTKIRQGFCRQTILAFEPSFCYHRSHDIHWISPAAQLRRMMRNHLWRHSRIVCIVVHMRA